jgi:FAD-NAD(P)-binding
LAAALGRLARWSARAGLPGRHDCGDIDGVTSFPETQAVKAPSIAIVGAGFSGALLAVHLARQAVGRLDIALIDRAAAAAAGSPIRPTIPTIFSTSASRI